jgi:hypothetical protein
MKRRAFPVAFAALTAALGLAGAWLLFTTFRTYDDEGYVLFALANFSRDGGLYTQVYSQYGPCFFLFADLTHRLLDLATEDYRVHVLGEEPRGSTGRGITPAYLDEVGQQQITFSDFLAGPNYFARKLAQRADRALRVIQHVCRVSPETFAGFFDKLFSPANTLSTCRRARFKVGTVSQLHRLILRVKRYIFTQ